MAAAAVQPPNIVAQINGHHFGAIKNKNADRSGLEQVIEYGKSANGNFRELQLIDRICRAVSMILKDAGKAFASFFDDLSGKCGTAWGMLTIPRLPAVTRDAWEALTTWGNVEGPEGYPIRAATKRVHDLAECAAAWFYGLSIVSGSMEFKNLGDVPNTISDVTDAGMAGQDLFKATEYLSQIDVNQTELKERFEGTRTEALLRLVKATASVVSSILGQLALVLGGPMLNAAALLTISLTSTVFSMASHFYKETRTYEIVKFYENRNPAILDGDPAHQVY